jgi:hypothetical protein
MGRTAANQNHIYNKTESGLFSGNACCHSVQNVLSSFVQYKNLKTKIHKTVTLPFILYECETGSLAVKVKCIRVVQNKVLRKTFGHKKLIG